MSVLSVRQPSLANPWRTSEGESKRHPDSWKPVPVRNQLNPVALPPPYSASTALRPLLPYVSVPARPGLLTPSLVFTDNAPPSVFNPNSGSDPGTSVMSEIALLSIRSQLTTSPNGWFCLTPST